MHSSERALDVGSICGIEVSEHRGGRPAPAPGRHERRRRPGRRGGPADRPLGRGARRIDRRDPAIARRRRAAAARLGRPRRHAPPHGRSRPRPAAGSARPALEGHRSGAGFSARFEVAGVQANDHRAVLALVDAEARLAAQVELRVGPSGLFHQRLSLRNTGDTRYTCSRCSSPSRCPWDATELLDTTGHHLRERTPAAAALHLRHAPAREPARPARRRRDAAPRRRPPGLRLRVRSGPRHPRRVERKPPRARRARRSPARRSSPAASCSGRARRSSRPGTRSPRRGSSARGATGSPSSRTASTTSGGAGRSIRAARVR